MGQYYKPINIDRMEYIYTHNYNDGLKLMEHSYIGNTVMEVVENLLSPEGTWYKCHLVWAGDYADDESETPKGNNLNHLVGDTPIRPEHKKANWRYVINHTLKVFVDKKKIKKDKDGYRIHPLSLLTAEGCGRGGGDFRNNDPRVGTWARHIISVDNVVPEGYTEVNGQFKE